MTRAVRGEACALALVLASLAILATAGTAQAALVKPAYAAGDRWIYVLQGSLDTLPGLNASQGATIDLGLNGLVEVDIIGSTQAVVGSTPVPGVRVATHASGYLNGTFAIPGNATIDVSGTFSSDATEVWEDQAYLPVASNSSSSYLVDVTLVITAQVRADLWVNATTTYAALPVFNLGVGDSAVAPFTTDLTVSSSVSFFGETQTMENRTTLDSTWSRHVLSQENVTVQAGTFSAYRLNESLGGLPGFEGVTAAGGANETAWFSNEVGYYVKRVAYVNGTPVAEMRLKSYTYQAPNRGLSLLDWTLLLALSAAAVAVLVLLLVRRRRARAAAKTPGGAGRVGELPPKDQGGGP